MGYRIRFDNGHEVEFQSKPSDADIDEAYKATAQLPQPDSGSGFLDNLEQKGKDLASQAWGNTKDILGEVGKTLLNSKGIGLDNPSGTTENIANIGSSMAGMAGAVPVAGLKAANNITQGQPANFEQNYADAIDRMTYKPKTPMGQEMQGDVGEFMNRNVIPLAPIMGEAGGAAAALHEYGVRKALTVKGENVPVPKSGLDVEGAIRDTIMPENEGGLSAPGSISTPLPDSIPVTGEGQGVLSPQDLMFKQMAEQKAQAAQAAAPEPGQEMAPNDPFAQMKSQLGVPQRAPEVDPVMAQMAQRLQGEQPSPLRSQMELPFNQRPDLDLQNEGAMAPKPDVPQAVPQQPDLFGNGDLFDLQREQGQPAPDRPATGEGMTQGELPVDEPQLALANEGEMAPKNPPEPITGQESDMFGPELKLDPNVQFPKLPDNSLYEQMKAEAQERAVQADPRIQESTQRVQDATQAYQEAAAAASDGRLSQQHVTRMADNLRTEVDAHNFLKQRVAEELQMKAQQAAAPKSDGPLTKPGDQPPPENPNGKGIRQISPGGKQTGAIMLPGKKLNAVKNLATKLDIDAKLKELAPSHWTPEQALDEVRKGQDVNQSMAGRAINFLTKGGQYLAMKLHNPMLRYTVERFTDADRMARADVGKWLHAKNDGLGALMRGLSNKEFSDTWAVIEAADLHQKPIDPVKLAERGASKAQLDLIQKHREAMDYALKSINKVRDAAGLDPVSPRAAYAAMQSTGDFRSLVYDQKGGKVIGVISSDFRARLNRLKQQMIDKGYHVDQERYFGGGNPTERGGTNEAFMRATEMLGEKDPKIADFLNVLDEVRKTELNNFLNMKRHTMQKKGIFGMEGRKPWESAYQNAKDGFKTQMNYFEGAVKWGHMADAFKDVKSVMDHPDSAHMPMAKELSQRYIYNALGYNPSEIGRKFEGALATVFDKAGVGYSVARDVMSKARMFTNSALLTLRPAFWYQNIVQPLMAMPGMKADLIARGLDAGFDFGTGYSYVAQGTHSAIRINAKVNDLTPLERAAAEYSNRKHVFSTDLIEHSNYARKSGGYFLDQMNNMFSGNIEAATRKVMFHAFVHMLNENGMSIKNGLFESAHNLTDISMNNYSALERPQIYNTLGPAGHLAVNLQSYKHNELSRVAMFARDSKEYKSIRPIAADMLARFAFGGAMGMIAYDDADAMIHFVSKMLGHPTSLSDLTYKASEGFNKFMYDKTGGKFDQPYLMSNGIHSMMGLDLSRSLGLTGVAPSSVGDALFPGGSKMIDGLKSLYDLTPLPGSNGSGMSEMNLKRAAYENAPLALQGALNNAWFTTGKGDNRLALRPRDLAAQAHRNDSDYMKKEFGFTGINESVERTKTYNVERKSRDYADLRQGPLNSMRDSLFSQGKLNRSDVADYIKYRGNPDTLPGDLQRYAMQEHLTPEQIAYMKSESSSAIGAILKAQDYAKTFAK